MLKLETDVPNTDVGAPTTEFGLAKNDTLPGDNEGTPLIKKWVNDLYYAIYAVLFKAGVVPSGTVENTSASDFSDALTILMNEHQSADFFNPTPQLTPNNTVLLAKAVVRDPDDPIAEPVQVAADAASAITFAGVATGDTRRDRLVYDKLGNITKRVGTPATLPAPSLPPAFVADDGPICQIFITTDGTPVIDNVADIIIDERIINRLLQDIPSVAGGKVILSGTALAAGTINFQAGDPGVSVTLVKSATGVYDYTLIGASGFTNVVVLSQLNENASSRYNAVKAATPKSADTGFPTNAGFRLRTVQLNDLTGGGPGIYTEVDLDIDHSFAVIGL